MIYTVTFNRLDAGSATAFSVGLATKERIDEKFAVSVRKNCSHDRIEMLHIC